MKSRIIFFIVSLLSIGSYAQYISYAQIKEFGTGELSSNLITEIAQDSYGFIWVATDYGLNKFDGMHFTHYLHNDNNTSLLSNNVRTLLIDKENNLWIGLNKGLQYYDPDNDSFITVSFPEDLTPHVTKIIQLHTGEIWITTSGWGVFSINKETASAQQLKRITEITHLFSGFIYEDRQHNIWVGIDRDELACINPVTYEVVRFAPPEIRNGNITGMLEDNTGRFLMSTSTTVSTYDRNEQKFIPIPLSPKENISITRLIQCSNGIVYIATDGQGLKYLDNNSNQIMSIDRQDSFIYNNAKLSAIREDRDHNLWLGCFQEGIFMIPNHSTGFEYLEVVNKDQYRGKQLITISDDEDNNIWCSINGEGLFKINPESKASNRYNRVTDYVKLHRDNDNCLWASSYSRGLAKINKETGEATFLPLPVPSYFKTITSGTDKHLYVSAFGHGFIRFNPQTDSHEVYNMNKEDARSGKLDNDWINDILCDSDGLVWLGHYKGVSCFNPTQKSFITFSHKDILSEQVCISLAEGHDKTILIGTYNGLFIFDKSTGDIRQYTIDNGLSSNVICGIVQDKEGNSWLSTFNGINCLRQKDKRIVSYYSGNGLVDRVYNRGVYYYQPDNNRIFFGGNNGITFFTPDSIGILSYNNTILTTNVYIHNQPINKNTLSSKKRIVNSGVLNANNFRFSYEDNTFTFEFSTMDFKDPSNIHYEYRLKELSNTWSSTASGSNRITYNYLNTGKYTFEVRAVKYGAYSPTKQLFLTISPPWYKTTSAFLAYLGICSLIILMTISLIRKKRKEQINEARLQFFINISHEIRSPLTLIISPMEKLLTENHDASTLKILQGMHRNANRILGLVNQLLDIRKLDKGLMNLKYSETELISFINEIVKVFEYQAGKRSICFTFRHNTDTLPIWIDRNSFDKVLMNLLSNAFKYTPDKGEITISLSTGMDKNYKSPTLRHYAEINIIDSGIGLDENKTERIFERFYQNNNQGTFSTQGSGIGLSLAQKLVHLHHGIIFARNRQDAQGSCFTIRIPLGKEHLKKEELTEYIAESYCPTPDWKMTYEASEKGKSIKRKTNYRILIIDDEAEIRDYLIDELQSSYHTLTASDGAEGLQAAIVQQPDLIISDIMMPNMDGNTLVKQLKSNNNTAHIPVVLLTSKTELENRIEGLEKGADAYLTKPFNVKELLTTISNLIKNRQLLKGKFTGAQEQADKIKPINFKSPDELLMERITSVINENISNPNLNVEMLSSEVNLSRSQLHRRMKELTGITTSDFIRNIRLQQAATLLRKKGMDVSQVAYAVGFSNQTYFSTLFKKFHGLSPTDYIAQNRE